MIIQLIYKFNFFFSTKRLFESFLFTEYEMLDTYALTNVKKGSGTHFNETLVGLLRYRDLSFYFLFLGYFLEFKFGRHVARKLVGNFQLYKINFKFETVKHSVRRAVNLRRAHHVSIVILCRCRYLKQLHYLQEHAHCTQKQLQ